MPCKWPGFYPQRRPSSYAGCMSWLKMMERIAPLSLRQYFWVIFTIRNKRKQILSKFNALSLECKLTYTDYTSMNTTSLISNRNTSVMYDHIVAWVIFPDFSHYSISSMSFMISSSSVHLVPREIVGQTK